MRPKITGILHTRRYYSISDLINQFKSHVWSIMESHNGAIFHAATSILEKFDSCQRHFLQDIGTDESEAFLHFNFAPPTLRRNIGMLGMLHKRVLGKCHPDFKAMFPWFTDKFNHSPNEKHNKQLYGHFMEIQRQVSLYKRSIFAMVEEYNRLPQYVVDSESISAFQSKLTEIAHTRCQHGLPQWRYTFDIRLRYCVFSYVRGGLAQHCIFPMPVFTGDSAINTR